MKNSRLVFSLLKNVLLFTAIASVCSCQKEAPPPNVVVLFTDDQRYNTIQTLGNKEIHTPNMDRLVQMGVSFTRAYVMGSHHGAVCAPSRAMLLSGKPYMNIPKAYIDPGKAPTETDFPFTTFPELLKSKGYSTFFTGKWHNHTSKLRQGFDDGANVFIGGMHWPEHGGHRSPRLWDFDPSGQYKQSKKQQKNEFSSKLYSDAAIDFIQSQPKHVPFCLYVAYTSPHDPREAPEAFSKLYDTSKIQLPSNFLPEHPFDNGHLGTRDELLAPFPRTPGAIKAEIAAYYAMISEVDAQIGRIIDALEDKSLLDNTLIVFAGDNGLAVGQHGLLGKQNLYEHSVRVPLVISGPGIKGGRRAGTLCYLHDIFPTICDVLGLEIPRSVEGKSLFPALQEETAKVRDYLFLAHSRQMRAVRTDDDWKLIRYFVNGEVREQLFSLKDDPLEMKNLANEKPASKKSALLDSLLASSSLSSEDGFIQVFINQHVESFGQPIEVSLTNPLPRLETRFTLDGSPPQSSSELYETPFSVKSDAVIKAALFLNGKPVGAASTATIKINKIIKDIDLLTKPSEKYAGKDKYTLADGANGSLDFKNGGWLGYYADDFEAVIELKRPKKISEIGLRYLSSPGSWIFPPKKLQVLVSDDGLIYKKLLNYTFEEISADTPARISDFKKEVPPHNTTFIKFKVEKLPACPDWHPGKGAKAWAFIDELYFQ